MGKRTKRPQKTGEYDYDVEGDEDDDYTGDFHALDSFLRKEGMEVKPIEIDHHEDDEDEEEEGADDHVEGKE